MRFSESFGRRALQRGRSGAGQAADFNIGLLLPLSGSMGLLGPSAYACARLACETWNAGGGMHGRPVHLTLFDAGVDSPALYQALDHSLGHRHLDAVVALSNTDVCWQVSEAVQARVPLVFTPQFEGHGLPAWVHAIGETPEHQLLPALQWMAERYRTRRWYLLGSDYCWPRLTHAAAIRFLRSRGEQVVGERYVALGTTEFDGVVDSIARSAADAVLINLIGSDAIHMCRAFGAAGLSRRVLRLSSCIEENGLIGMGADNTDGLFVSAGYFAAVESPSNAVFKERYHTRFGERSPALNSLAQSVYEGFVHLWRQTQRGTAAAPRQLLGSVRTQAAQPQLPGAQPVYMAQAEGMAMRVIAPLRDGLG